MSNKSFKAIRNLTNDELTAKLRETEGQLFKSKMSLATGQLSDTASIWKFRKEIARIRTRQTQMMRESK